MLKKLLLLKLTLFIVFCAEVSAFSQRTTQVKQQSISNLEYENFYDAVLKAKRKGDPETNSKYRRLIEMSSSVDSVELVANTYVEYSIYLSNHGVLDTALLFAFKAEELNYERKNVFVSARILHAMGWYYHNLGDYESALIHYNNSISLFESINLKRDVENTLKKVSITYDLLGQHAKSLEIYDRLYLDKLCEDCPDAISALLFKTYTANDTARTLNYILKYHASIKNSEDHKKHNSNWHEIKAIEAEYQKDQDKEIYHLRQAQKIIERNNRPRAKARIYENLGDSHLKYKNYNSAESYFLLAYQINNDHGFKSAFPRIIKKLTKISKLQGNNENAQKYVSELDNFNSEINNKRVIGQVLNQSHQVKITEKQAEIDSLRNARITQKRFLYLLSIFSLLALILMSVSIYFYLKYRKLSRRLAEKNKALDLSNQEKQTLLQETHHRVKNNLQIIASLLNLQRKYTKDKNLTGALIDGRNRVKSMALIHQLLYQNKEIKGINVRNYVKNLMSSLLGSFKVDEDKIKFVNHVAPLDLHEDSLLSIGLIINELATNSLKYAFGEREYGTITVQLNLDHEQLILIVKDDGIGISQDLDLSNNNSFGYSLIHSLLKKLGAKMTIDSENGTEVQLLITKFRMA